MRHNSKYFHQTRMKVNRLVAAARPCSARRGVLVAAVTAMALTLVLFYLVPSPGSAGNSSGGSNASSASSAQPRLLVSANDITRNRGLPRVLTSTLDENGVTYHTLVYVWQFSTNPWWARFMGYPSHDWDYEPVIVSVTPNGMTYTYDSGHYRVASTNSDSLRVVAGNHSFNAAEQGSGERLSPELFTPAEKEDIQRMNTHLSQLPRLPFHRGLSLDWAFADPERVIVSGSFSSDRAQGPVPPQLNAIAGLLTALGIVVFSRIRSKRTTVRQVAVLLGTGVAAGLGSGFLSQHAQATLGVHALGVLTSVLSVILASLLMTRLKLPNMIQFASVVLVAGLLTALW